MGTNSNLIPLTHKAGSGEGRVPVDVGSTGFFLGREFRTYWEVNKTAAQVRYFRVTSLVDFILLFQRLTLNSGAARLSAWTGAAFAGAWTSVPVIGRNRMTDRETPLYTSQITFETALGPTGSFTGGTEVDLIRVHSGTNQGNQSSSNVNGDSLTRGLPPGTYGIKIEPITGITNADQVTGVYELAWEERPNTL
ncbi:hypothetical protein [Ralstonia phage RpT1]|nr:hypothetical protein [Ralstonia phage RpT1]